MVPNDIWPWIALAALGLFHGLNPAMGWLFAVALGLQRGSERVVLLSLAPIAIGHAAAVAVVLAGFLALGSLVDRVTLSRVAAAILIGWAIWHLVRGHRQRLVVGMQTGLAGLALWSFLMASAHGAGLMLIPVLLPICATAAPTPELTADAIPVALAALGLHSAVMLATIAAVSIIVYQWMGVAFLRRGWINLDWLWVGALLVCGVLVLVT
jgi:hypothetical protein